MGAQNNRMLFTKLSDQVPDLDYLLGIKSNGGLVKYQDLRVSQDRLSHSHPLLVSF